MRLLRSLPLFIALTALCCAASLHAAPDPRLTTRLETCEAILREFQDDPELAIPDSVLRNAEALVIVNQVKGGLILGLQYGYGVVLARRDDRSWSVPVFIRAGEASLGLQLGGQRIETIYVLMDRATVRRLFEGRVNIGVDAQAVAGPRVYETEQVNRDILTTPVLVYGRNQGIYAGATIKTGWIDRNDSANWDYYDTPYILPELLYGNFVQPPPEVRPLRDYVAQITR
jgi:lipid-binding SYLF domain-containing protein